MLLVLKYSLFALISSFANVFTQYCVDLMSLGFIGTYISLLMGSIVGLITKYILDKKYIFYYNSLDFYNNLKKFILYSFLGVFTTMIFWGIELTFFFIFNNIYAKYLGAMIGLTIGYIIKFNLDKKYVFVNNQKY